MIRHMVLLTWRKPLTQQELLKVRQGFSALADELPQIASYSFGEDAGFYKGNADFGLVADFLTEKDFASYVADEKHQAFMKTVTGPLMESYQSIQFTLS